MLCQYRGLFGEVGEGIHSYRIGDIAVIDVIAVLIGASIISGCNKKKYWRTVFALFLLGILFHRLFCVRTTVDKFLFK